MISTVIVTYNEEKNLKDCLESVDKQSDKILVVDLGSTDQTLQIAKTFNVKIFKHPKADYVEQVRNSAVAKAEGEWVLVLDPDERITLPMWRKLKEVIKEDKFDAVNIPRKNIFFGKWIAHSNWWPDKHIRFFKKGKVIWSNKIHAYPSTDGRILELPPEEEKAIIHYGYDTIKQFMDRQNRYSDIEAQNLFDLGERFSWSNFLWRPTREFIVRYLRHLGFLDGFYGFALIFLMMLYQMEVMIKLWELEKR